ncbi:MAG: LacI family DNA-binding transcriptional regulator [Treponema sp.]
MASHTVPTIYDVAKEAGVSAATVSRVLNDPAIVSEKKRKAVQETIAKLHFKTKFDAAANARKNYKKIGVVAPLFTQPSFTERLRGISECLSSKNIELVIYALSSEADLENYITTLAATNRVDGLIFLCVHLEKNMIDLLRTAPFPVSFVEEDVDGFDSIVIKNLKGGQKAGECLFNAGCRTPGFVGDKICSGYGIAATDERLRGFHFFWANQGIVLEEKNIWIGDFSENGIERGIEEFLSRDEIPDGVFCSSDVIALRLIRLARAKGIDVPNKMKVIGFDNIELSEYTGLSSVSQSLEESGRLAAKLVLERIENPKKPVCRIELSLEVIERDTTGKR